MSMPFYVSPEQQMKDRADFARKGIGRGRSVVVVQYADGVLFVAENQSPSLHKISEIYDRLAFAAVGRYNEFENLRIAGVRLADMRGYSYDRRDVTGRGLANAYAQTLGAIFSSGGEKPYEVELFVAEVADRFEDDQVYRLTYDGSVADAQGCAAMGGSSDQVTEYLKSHYREGLDLDAALHLAVVALENDSAATRTLAGDRLEVAVLDRTRLQPRKFRRIAPEVLTQMFGTSAEAQTLPKETAPTETAPPDTETSKAPPETFVSESAPYESAATAPVLPSDGAPERVKASDVADGADGGAQPTG